MRKKLLPTEIPTKPGYYWAKWKIPSDDTPPEVFEFPFEDRIIHVFRVMGSLHKARTKTDEVLLEVPLADLSKRRDLVPGLQWIIPLCLDRNVAGTIRIGNLRTPIIR